MQILYYAMPNGYKIFLGKVNSEHIPLTTSEMMVATKNDDLTIKWKLAKRKINYERTRVRQMDWIGIKDIIPSED